MVINSSLLVTSVLGLYLATSFYKTTLPSVEDPALPWPILLWLQPVGLETFGDRNHGMDYSTCSLICSSWEA